VRSSEHLVAHFGVYRGGFPAIALHVVEPVQLRIERHVAMALDHGKVEPHLGKSGGCIVSP
jgi:hypothetical protein